MTCGKLPGECRRVLRRGGRLFLRTATREQISNYPYIPFFPANRRLLEGCLPSLGSAREAFEQAAFRHIFTGIIVQQIAPDHGAYADKLACGADSILAQLDPAEFAAGLEAIRMKHGAAGTPGAVVEPIDFVVLERHTDSPNQ